MLVDDSITVDSVTRNSWLINSIIQLLYIELLECTWLTARGSGMASVCLMTDTDSPVRMDWSILRVVEKILSSLMSAGILSPTVTDVRV